MMWSASGCSPSSNDADPAATETPSTEPVGPSSEFVAGADDICSDAESQFTALGKDPEFPDNATDPVREGLVRPAARIYAEQAEALRGLADRLAATPDVATYFDYFEVIDTLLQARLRVGEPGGPDSGEAHELELRFQAMSQEQSEAATTAGLSACAIDVPALLLGQ